MRGFAALALGVLIGCAHPGVTPVRAPIGSEDAEPRARAAVQRALGMLEDGGSFADLRARLVEAIEIAPEGETARYGRALVERLALDRVAPSGTREAALVEALREAHPIDAAEALVRSGRAGHDALQLVLEDDRPTRSLAAFVSDRDVRLDGESLPRVASVGDLAKFVSRLIEPGDATEGAGEYEIELAALRLSADRWPDLPIRRMLEQDRARAIDDLRAELARRHHEAPIEDLSALVDSIASYRIAELEDDCLEIAIETELHDEPSVQLVEWLEQDRPDDARRLARKLIERAQRCDNGDLIASLVSRGGVALDEVGVVLPMLGTLQASAVRGLRSLDAIDPAYAGAWDAAITEALRQGEGCEPLANALGFVGVMCEQLRSLTFVVRAARAKLGRPRGGRVRL